VTPKVTPKISPAKNPAPAATAKYKVGTATRCGTTAQRFGMSMRDLMAKNNLEKSAIYAGQILLVK
jgi:LysM repeat protein